MKKQMWMQGILAVAMMTVGFTTGVSAQPAAGSKVNQPVDKASRPAQAPSVESAATAASKKADSAGHAHGAGHPGPGAMTGGGMMKGKGGMKGAGMMGAGMMGADCPMMAGGPDTKMEVKKLAKGVAITMTSDDPAAVTKLQEMAERMQVKHQAHAH